MKKEAIEKRFGKPCAVHSVCNGIHKMDDDDFECEKCGYSPTCFACQVWEAYQAGQQDQKKRDAEIAREIAHQQSQTGLEGKVIAAHGFTIATFIEKGN